MFPYYSEILEDDGIGHAFPEKIPHADQGAVQTGLFLLLVSCFLSGHLMKNPIPVPKNIITATVHQELQISLLAL